MLRAYTRLVRWSVRHHYMTVALGLLIFVGSIGSFYLLPSGFLPAEDSSRLLLAVELPPGSRIADTRAVTDEIARKVRERPEVRERVRQRRPGHGLRRGGAQGDVRHQSGAQGRNARSTPGPDAARDRSQASPACPTSASGS